MRLLDFCVTPTEVFYFDHAHKINIPVFDVVYMSPDNAEIDRYIFLRCLYAASDGETIDNAVSMYCSEKTKRVVVLKTLPASETEELEVVQELSRSKSPRSTLDASPDLTSMKRARVIDCNETAKNETRARLVAAHVAYQAQRSETSSRSNKTEPRDYNAILMPYAGTQLRHMQRTMTQDEVINVVLMVARTCKALLAEGWVYVDLKASNIVLDAERRPMLVDYGSIYKVGTTYACATYPPPNRPHGTGVPASESIVVYGLGVLLASVVQSFDCERGFRFVKCKKTLAEKTRREEFRKAADGLRRAASELIENAVSPALREVYIRSIIVQSSLEEFIQKLKVICERTEEN